MMTLVVASIGPANRRVHVRMAGDIRREVSNVAENVGSLGLGLGKFPHMMDELPGAPFVEHFEPSPRFFGISPLDFWS